MIPPSSAYTVEIPPVGTIRISPNRHRFWIARMQTLFVLENLDNLRKNGRLTRMQALVTGALRVKLLCGATRGKTCGGICPAGLLRPSPAFTKKLSQ